MLKLISILKKHEEAIILLTDNDYEEASSWLPNVYELNTAYEIEKFYDEMLNEIEACNPDKWNPNFDYIVRIDFLS